MKSITPTRFRPGKNLIILLLACSPFNSYAQLSGSYTIDPNGGAFPNFVSLSAAVDALHSQGVSAPVFFNIADGTYNERITLQEVSGAGSSSRITFQSASGDSTDVVLTFSNSNELENWVLRLDGADYITIKGLSLISTGNPYAGVVYINGVASHNMIEHCRIVSQNGSSSEFARLIASSADKAEYNIIRNNYILNGSYGIMLQGADIDNWSMGTEISGNTFENQTDYAAYLSHQYALLVERNEIHSLQDEVYGIFTELCNGGLRISANKIVLENNSWGGIKIFRCNGESDQRGSIVNNFVTIGGDETAACGINVECCNYQNVYHNSALVTSTLHSDKVGALYIRDVASATYGYSSHIALVNNIYANVGGGYAAYEDQENLFEDADYNNFYSTGEFIGYFDVHGPSGFFRSEQAGLEMLQIIGIEKHSLCLFPGFISDTDLHINSYWLNGAGTPTTGITVDFDGETRSMSPDIGADEYTPTVSPLTSGTYSIGGSGPDYETIREAFDDLTFRGVSGPVTFEIRTGWYNEYVPMIRAIPGISDEDSVVIRSASGDPEDVIIHYVTNSSTRNIFDFYEVGNITFRDLTISAMGATLGRAFNFYGNCSNVNIVNNFLASNNASDEIINISSSNNSSISDISILNNSFGKGDIAINYTGGVTQNSSGTRITGNSIYNPRSFGIYLYMQDNPEVCNNQIIQTNDSHSTTGISLFGCDHAMRVTNNKIFTTNGKGIEIGSCEAVLPFKGLIANNMIRASGEGIFVQYSTRQKICYNSIEVSGSYGGTGVIFNYSSSEELELVNNIISCIAGNPEFYDARALYVTDPTDVAVCDHNGYYSNKAEFVSWGGTDYTSLTGLRGASGMDEHSLFADPMFYSDSGLYTLQAGFHEAGMPVSEVQYDYHGNERDPVKPDLGAVEFTCVKPDFNVYITPVCQGDTTLIIDSTLNIAPGSTRGWDMDGDLIADVYTEHPYDSIRWVFDEGNNTITYIVRQIAGCNDFTTLSANVIPSPELEFETRGAYCDTDDGWAKVIVTNMDGPLSYVWSNGTRDSINSNLAMGTYTVVVSDPVAGCSSAGEVIIGEAIEVTVTQEDPSSCGASDGSAFVEASGGIPPYSYVWSNGITEAYNDSLTPGPHYVNVIDDEGCYAQGLVNIENTDGPQISLVSLANNDCHGGFDGNIDIDISGGSEPYDIVWSNGEFSEDLEQLAAGVYNVVVMDADSCKVSQSFEIAQPARMSVTPLVTDASCGLADGKAIAAVSGGVYPYSYQWSSGGIYEIEKGLAAGVYSVLVTDAKGCEMLAPVIISNVDGPVVTVTDIRGVGCLVTDNGSITVSAEPPNPFYSFVWSSGQTTPAISGLSAGTYEVTVTDEEDCMGLAEAVIEQEPPEVNPICIVTVDTTTGKNLVLWTKEYTEGVSHYNIYRETTQKGVYQKIDSVRINEESVYHDETADPGIRSWRYKISVVDVCGQESELSPHHKTMHLTMNIGLNHSVNLIWDHYEGFEVNTYKIWRFTDETGWVNIADVPSNLTSYTDQDPPVGYLTYYIEVVHPDGCQSTDKKPRRLNSSRSNRRTSKKSKPTTGVNIPGMTDEETGFRIYPNPGTGIYSLEIENDAMKVVSIRVFDITGKMVLTEEQRVLNGRLEREIDLTHCTGGLYQVHLLSDQFSLHEIIVKKE